MTKSTKWIDLLVIAFSLAVIGASAWGMLSSGVFDFALYDDAQLTWHLIRSSGIVAYVLMVASTVWGLFISSQLVKDWSPGPISITLHSTLSWLALALGLGHGLLLMFDDYFTYSLSDVFVPFTGPYRPEVVGLGTLALWLIIAVTLSFPLRKRLGHTLWKRLHYLSYVAFGLVTVHGLLAGTDAEHLGFRLLTGIGVLLVVLLLGMRLGRDQSKPAQAKARKSAAS
ncbi:MAG: ferric reductase-like transmembrane domain-containing protein [Anaerolineae bacterium]|nr:ferric reductase-like transmembrane domain-containing protein [Anaerolineae bacterium]